MRGGLWLVRLLLTFVVGVVVLSPLVVHGEAAAPQPLRLDYDTSGLLLPSSPVYPGVTAYRDMRLSFAELEDEKADLSLDFANSDAVSIRTLVEREDYVAAARHCATFQDNFDHAVGWMVIAAERGFDVTSLLSRLKNDHLSQQWILGEAARTLPEWSGDGINVARRHTATVLTEAVSQLEGSESASQYMTALATMSQEPEFFGSAPQQSIPVVQTPSLAFATAQVPQPVVESTAPSGGDTEAVGPDIASLSVSPDTVEPKGTCRVTCNVICDDETGIEYTWWCSKGSISPSGSTARWTAPSKPGTYQIRVTVMDANGAGDAQSINVSVAEEEEEEPEDTTDDEGTDPGSSTPPASSSSSPDILGLSVTADHKYLEQSMVGYAILVSRDCTIQCEVADDRGITFKWECSGGEFDGSGDTVKWLAPAGAANHTVTVTARNSKGQEDSVTLAFHVTTCSQCF